MPRRTGHSGSDYGGSQSRIMPSPTKESPPAILIVDDDLGFLVWLGLTLGAAGFVTVPAAATTQAGELIHELHIAINLAVVNLDLPGMSDFTASLTRRDPMVKIIAIQDSTAGPAPAIKTDASHSRSKLGWMTLVRKLMGIEKATGAL